MNTFLAAMETVCTPYLARTIETLKSIPIDRRIYNRGIREQRNAIFLSDYYPNAAKRLIRKRANIKIGVEKFMTGSKNAF